MALDDILDSVANLDVGYIYIYGLCVRYVGSFSGISFPWNAFFFIAHLVRVLSHAYTNTDIYLTSAHIRLILESRAVLLSFRIGFNLVSTAVVCAVD